jgi:hypothetical protein
MILEGTIGFCELNLKFAGETINVSSKSKSIQIVLFVASYPESEGHVRKFIG